MDYSEEWKSLFPIQTVYSAPLLLSTTTTTKPNNNNPVGPLCFNPKPKTLKTLFTSPSLSPPFLFPPPRLSFPSFLSSSAPIPLSHASRLGPSPVQHGDVAASLLSHNRLQCLHNLRSGSVFVFFPTGENLDKVGFLVVCVKGKSLVASGESDGSVFTVEKCVSQKILRILVNPVVDSGGFGGKFGPFGDGVVGYLLAFTMYSVHWFCVKVGESSDVPVLDYLGCKLFKTCHVAGACWSPHLVEQSVVLLEDGSLFLFDLETDCLKGYFRGTRLRVYWDDEGVSEKGEWLGCEFSWDPRTLIVSHRDAVLLVDWRYDGFKVTCLAKVDMFGMYARAEKERLLAISKLGLDHFRFVLASNSMLAVCDVRKPLSPVLQWEHGLQNPCYIDVFSLSQLRSNARYNEHEWANSSGLGIILGSFWNCEFSLFSCGPMQPVDGGSISSGLSMISKPLYAWDLPSNLSLSGPGCRCGSCLIREEFFKDTLPDWVEWQQKKEIVLGFCILPKASSSVLFDDDDDDYGGFTLIRLLSSGKLEMQRYYASWDLVTNSNVAHGDPLPSSKDNLLYSMGDDHYRFPRRFKYCKFDYVNAYLDGNLSQVLDSSMAKPSSGHLEKETFNLEFHEILCEKLKICGLSRFRTSPLISVVFNDIDLPTSMHEIAWKRIWANLPIELLQLAFSSYAEFLDVLVDKKKVALEFLVVPDRPQLPPFFLRKPSNRSNHWSNKVQHGDSPVGPVLPLPVLITLHELRNGCPSSQEEIGGFSSEVELNNQCSEVMQVAKEMAVLDSTTEFQDEKDAVSLADERDDIWASSGKQKPFVMYCPTAVQSSSKEGSGAYKDDKFSLVISKVRKKQAPSREVVKTVGREFFDDLCPIDLKFDDKEMSFGLQELKAYSILKRHYSKWQADFAPYRQFSSQLAGQKQGA